MTASAPTSAPTPTEDLRELLLRDGHVLTGPLLETAEAARYRDAIMAYHQVAVRVGGVLGSRWNSPKPHLLAGWADELAHHPRLVDVAKRIVGPDVLVWSIDVLLHRAGTAQGFGWHQDGPYLGWRHHLGEAVRLWVALTDTSVSNGTMQVAPGTHGDGYLPHVFAAGGVDAMAAGAVVTVDVPEDALRTVAVPAGSASLHLPTTVHRSLPNVSAHDRVCLAIDYLSPAVRTSGPDGALLVAGTDNRHHFGAEQRLDGEFSPQARQQFVDACRLRDRLILGNYARLAGAAAARGTSDDNG